MIQKTGFDNERYIKEQTAEILITRFDEQPAAIIFKNKLERRGISVYTHRFTKGYPTDVETIVSKNGNDPPLFPLPL